MLFFLFANYRWVNRTFPRYLFSREFSWFGRKHAASGTALLCVYNAAITVCGSLGKTPEDSWVIIHQVFLPLSLQIFLNSRVQINDQVLPITFTLIIRKQICEKPLQCHRSVTRRPRMVKGHVSLVLFTLHERSFLFFFYNYNSNKPNCIYVTTAITLNNYHHPLN